MDSEKSMAARKLMENFSRFNRVNWDKSPIEGLRSSELLVLFCVQKYVAPDSPGIKVSEISNRLQVTSPTVTQVVSSLEAAGYVERNSDKEDRRAVRIKLTAKGEEVMQKATAEFVATFNGLVDFLGIEQSNQLAELLAQVHQYFHEVKKIDFLNDRR